MNYIAEIEAYLRGEMSTTEHDAFESLLAKNDVLAKELSEYKELFDQFQHAKNAAFVNKQIAIIREQEGRNTLNITGGMRSSLKKYWRTAGIAAAVAFLASVGTYFVAENTFNNQDERRILQLVNKEVRDIKSKQVSLQKDIDEVIESALPNTPQRGAGTAFALSKDGYALTNAHVLVGGKKVYLFTKDGKAHRCDLIKLDKENDLAVLKIKDSTFTFSQQPIPYRLKQNAQLAQRVFTLGYPKSEVVYNEGYVSSLNGKNSDSTKFQLELPSSPGVSGAPVLDDKGNLIGIVNSKQKISTGVTYAIKAKVVNSLLDSLKAPLDRSGLQQNSFASGNRSAQIKSMEDFVFLVKVYK